MFAGFLILAALAWLFIGPRSALLLLVLCLIAAFAYHLHSLSKLVTWAREPIGAPMPRAYGLWDSVFAALSRRTRLSYDQRERLASALNRFREASQAMPDGVVYLSQHNFIEWMNVAAARHFGLNAERDIGAVLTNLVRQPDFVRYMEQEERSEPLIINEMRGQGLTLSIQIVPFGEDRKMVLSRDITQLERLETMRRDFVANVSHELKTPLTVVSGFIEMLLDNEDISPEDHRRYLSMALDHSGRMQRLIEDLLTLSALETGDAEPLQEQVDVHALLQSVAQEAEILSAGHHRIHLELGEEKTFLLGSHKELYSALANLASNAVRYTPDGGDITLRWQVSEKGGAFSVQDTGIGIDAKHLPRLTERFYRVDRGRSRDTGGTGLGLAIVKHILTRHQAVFEIESEPERGSCFTARFPSARVSAATAVKAQST